MNKTAKEKDKIIIICDFIFEGGSEQVIDCLLTNYPQAELLTTIYDPDDIKKYPNIYLAYTENRLKSSILQNILPKVLNSKKIPLTYYHFYWLYFLVATFQKTSKVYDRIIYSCCAHSKLIQVKSSNKIQSIVYYHTPTRYLYDGLMDPEDMKLSGITKFIFQVINYFIKPLDKLGVNRIKKLNAKVYSNSTYTQQNILKFYDQDSSVLFPPVTLKKNQDIKRDNKILVSSYFLYHGRVSFQKRVDIVIEACLIAKKSLVISGNIQDQSIKNRLTKIIEKYTSTDPTLEGLITFRGRTTDLELQELFANCSALLFPPREDFGIVPIEAMTNGIPVLAFNQGGALDYIKEDINGYFFMEQTAQSLANLILSVDLGSLNPSKIESSVIDCSASNFLEQLNK